MSYPFLKNKKIFLVLGFLFLSGLALYLGLKSNKFQYDNLYHQNLYFSGSVHLEKNFMRGQVLTANGESALLRITKSPQIDTDDNNLFNIFEFSLMALFKSQHAPYPGAVSNEIQCLEPQIKREQ